MVEETILRNQEVYGVSNKGDINPIIVSLPEKREELKPLITLLYHFNPVSIILEIYEDKIIIIKSNEKNTISLKINEYEKLKKAF